MGPMEEARDRVTVQVATIPERTKSLEVMVGSLVNQVDKIRVMLNNYDPQAPLPEFLTGAKIETVFCDNSLMDGFKFLDADKNKGYVLICDDDIEYAFDYVDKMKHWHWQMGKDTILSIMGKNLMPLPLESYAWGGHEFFRAFEYHTKFYKVNLIGMCGAIYHTDFCKISEKDMLVPDSDVCASAYAIRHRLPMWVTPHKADFCKDLTGTHIMFVDRGNTMWNHNKQENVDRQITAFINDNFREPAQPGLPEGIMSTHDDLG